MWYERIIWTGLCVLPCCTGLFLEWMLLAVAVPVPTTAAGIAVIINSIIVIVVIIVSPWRYTVRQ